MTRRSMSPVWGPAVSSHTAQRDYPIGDNSLILAMTDMVWSPPLKHDTMHAHNCMEIGVCLEGNGLIRMGGAEDYQPFQPGTVIIVPQGLMHCQQNMGQPLTRWRYIAVNEALLLQEAPARSRPEISQLIESAGRRGIQLLHESSAKEAAWLVQRMFDIRCSTSWDPTAELEIIILLILTRIARDEDSPVAFAAVGAPENRMIDPALLLIAQSYQQEIRISQLAHACAMSESHFRKVFAETMGISPLEYVNRYRIRRAMHMLKSTNDSVASIAENCGFLSLTTFNRNFLRHNGVTPTQWRHNFVQADYDLQE